MHLILDNSVSASRSQVAVVFSFPGLTLVNANNCIRIYIWGDHRYNKAPLVYPDLLFLPSGIVKINREKINSASCVVFVFILFEIRKKHPQTLFPLHVKQKKTVAAEFLPYTKNSSSKNVAASVFGSVY